MELAIPILEKVHNKQLRLYDHNLSEPQTQALRMASKFFSGSDTTYVEKLLLDNCCITDKQFAPLMESLANLKDFKSIIYRRNEFGVASAWSIKQLLHKRQPYHLNELRIVDCRITPQSLDKLMFGLNYESYLSTLALVNVKFSDRTMN